MRLLRVPRGLRMPSRRAFSASKAPPPSRPQAAFTDIVYGQDTGLRIVEFHRPAALNALTLPMVDHLTKRLHKMQDNSNVQAIIFVGAGDRAFCAGGDIRALYENGQDPARRQLARDFFRHEYRLNYLLATTEKPIISYLNGVTMGGGVGLSMHGKFVVATEKTQVAMPETAIGFYPDVGGSYLLPRLGRKLMEGEAYETEVDAPRALEGQGLGTYLALSGERLSGKECVGFGLATHYLPTEEYETMVHHLTGLEFPAEMPQEDRDDMVHEALTELEEDEACQEIDPEYMETVEKIFGAKQENDTVEGIFERLENHKTEWATQTLATLRKMSPLSLKVTLEQMRQGAVKSCAECFAMEYRISSRMLENPDFFEGVRAQIIDKTKTPTWRHRDVQQVSRADVESFFAPLPEDQELVLYSDSE